MSAKGPREALFTALLALVRPLIRFCLRYGFSIHDLVRVIKLAFVEIASEQILEAGSKPNPSRISVLTGLHRNDIVRLQKEDASAENSPQSVFGRVLVQWENDRRFSRKGRPRALSCSGEGSEFWKLVQTITTNIGPATVLLELLRSGRAVRTGDSVALVKTSLNLSTEIVKAYELVGRDFESLLESVSENISKPEHQGNLQIRTDFDNIYKKHIPRIREWLITEGREFHRKGRNFLAELDADITPDLRDTEGSGAKVTLSAFSHIKLPAGKNTRSN